MEFQSSTGRLLKTGPDSKEGKGKGARGIWSNPGFHAPPRSQRYPGNLSRIRISYVLFGWFLSVRAGRDSTSTVVEIKAEEIQELERLGLETMNQA
jgi:hypothetical protein